jgi:mannitol/fructose-specific phosphotransferase system IIA component
MKTYRHGIVHAGFRGMRAFVARNKSSSKLTGNIFVIPHDTIPYFSQSIV